MQSFLSHQASQGNQIDIAKTVLTAGWLGLQDSHFECFVYYDFTSFTLYFYTLANQ